MTLSLREARQRESDAVLSKFHAMYRSVIRRADYRQASSLATAARRATDEALVRAVLRLCGDIGSDPSAVLDAVEKAGSE